MEGIYDVWLKDKIAGEVLISREGLYYRFLSTVWLPKSSRYHLLAYWEGGNIDLGLCVPQGESFVLNKKIPIKRFDNRRYRYILAAKTVKQVTPIFENQPFTHLNRLPDSYFSVENNIPVIIIGQKGLNGA